MPSKTMSAEEVCDLKEFLHSQGYFNIRVLPDGIVCCIDMIFTRGVVIDPDFDSPKGGRVCYQNRDHAIIACNAMKSIYDDPSPGYSADKRAYYIVKGRKNNEG